MLRLALPNGIGRFLLAAIGFMISVSALAQTPPFQATPVVSTLNKPVAYLHAGDGSGRMFVVQKVGTVRVVKDGTALTTPFIDISAKSSQEGVNGAANENGLLGMAFHPNYESNGRFFLSYTTSRTVSTGVYEHTSHVEEYKVSVGDPDVADPTPVKYIFTGITSPSFNHKGGHIAFGPDGYLYFGLGDGGGGGDPYRTGQNLKDLRGKILRVDVDSGSPYAIPADNPYANDPDPLVRKETWAWGLRNPWRWSFDRDTGRLFCGDVGQNIYEEIDVIEAGRNYGWPITEGFSCYNAASCNKTGLSDPIYHYDHVAGTGGTGRCSITGGYVYRGSKYPSLQGMYFFADYCSREVWGLVETSPGVWTATAPLLLPSGVNPVSFGEDEAGELYIVSLGSTSTNGRIRAIQGFDTPTPSPTPSLTPSQSPTATPSASPTETPTPSPSRTPIPEELLGWLISSSEPREKSPGDASIPGPGHCVHPVPPAPPSAL